MTQTPMDYIIEGGLVVSGSAIARADVAVKNGLIAEIGPDLSSLQSASHSMPCGSTKECGFFPKLLKF